ncbi:MAG: glycosyltransferase [Thermoplasmatota archaeon]
MRIAMFSETYLPSANGVTTSIVGARRELSARGHEVQVFAAGERAASAPGTTYYGGRMVRRYPDFRLALAPAWGSPSPRRLVARWGADLAHLHSPGPMGWRGYHAATANHLPYVYTYHTHLEPLAQYAPWGTAQLVARFTAAVQDFLVRRSSCLVVPSHFLLDRLRKENPALAEGAIVVPTGIDTRRFHPRVSGAQVRAGWGLAPDDEVLLYLGRLGLEKRADFLLSAFGKVAAKRPHAHLVLAGRGPAADDLARQAAAMGLRDRVHLPGFVSDADLPAAYAAADAFVSASDFETQGLTLLEAMATGRPCAVAAAGGYLDPLRNGENGFLFGSHDLHEAAAAMGQALDAPSRLRTEARFTAEAYRLQACVRLLERVYEAAVAGVPVAGHTSVAVPGLTG